MNELISRPKEITASVFFRKIADDPLPRFRFSREEPGPDYGKPIKKGLKGLNRIIKKTKTQTFVCTRAAEEWQLLMTRHLERVVLPKAKEIALKNQQ